MSSDLSTNEDVAEVVSFVHQGRVLAFPFTGDVSQRFQTFRVITDFDNIDRYRDPDVANSKILDEMAWIDIQRVDEHLEQTLHDVEKWRAIELITQEFYDLLTTQFAFQLPEHEIREMSGQLEHLVFLRSTVGIIECFHEELFKIYKAGGYPCGWEGAYPNGELVVYSIQ